MSKTNRQVCMKAARVENRQMEIDGDRNTTRATEKRQTVRQAASQTGR